MSTAMERYIELVKQYPGQEQVESDIESDRSAAAEEIEEDGEED